MIPAVVRGLLLLAGCLPIWAQAQSSDPLPAQTQLVPVSGAPSVTQETFTIAAVSSGTQPDLLVTFTDFQTPAPLNAASVVVTQGAAIVAMVNLDAPAASATLTLPAAVGQFTLRVIGTPNAAAGIGTFSICVAPSAAPTACMQNASTAGSIIQQSTPADPTVSTVAATLTVVTGGAYTFTYADAQFPVALAVAPSLALFQGSQPVAVPIPASPAVINLSPGTYSLFAIAQADPTAKAGLYGIGITGPAGVAPLLNASYPVGLLAPAAQPNNPSAQQVTLSVTDFAFPSALASAAALATQGSAVLGMATAAGGPSAFAAPAGALQVWNYAAAGTSAGTYEVDLTASSSLLHSAFGVAGASTFAYAYVLPNALSAGAYQATANDFGFPAALAGLSFAVAQNGSVLDQKTGVGSLSFTAVAAPVVLLAAASPTGSSNGLFDINLQTGGASPQLVFDQVQPVSPSSSFTSQVITLGTSGNFNVTLNDLAFPSQFATLALVGTSNGTVLGSIYGGGNFAITAKPGNYQFTVVAIPAADQEYGLYGIQIADAAPVVTLSASPTSVSAGSPTTLTWTSTGATACTGSGGAFAGSQSVGSGSTSVSVSATTTYSLTCTGPGGSATATATVTATQAPGGSGGGGAIGAGGIAALAMLLLANRQRRATAGG
jgi:hypothetical protein